MLSSSCSLAAVCLAATIERIENERSASVTDSVPSAESLRPVNGNTSGPRWHWQLMLTRQTWLTRGSTSAPIRSGSALKMLTCWPCSEVMHVVERRLEVVERHHRHHRPELLLAVELHALGHRVDHRRVEQRAGDRAAALR